MIFHCVQTVLSRKFSQLGQFIAGHPLIFLLIPILITAILATGVLRIKEIRDVDYLFTATNERAITDKKSIEKLFTLNTSEFTDPARMLKPDNLIVITPKRSKYIFEADMIKEIEMLDKMVKNITVSFRGKILRYSDLCAISNKKCFENTPIRLLPYFDKIINGKYKLKYPAYIHPITYSYEEYVFCFGGTLLDHKGYIKNVEAVRLVYVLNTDRDEMTEARHKWQEKFNKLLKSSKFQNITINFITSQNIYNDLKDLTDQLIPKTPLALSIVVLFAIITCMTNDWIRSKPWLGPSACVSAILAVVSGFGLAFYIGIPYVDMTYLLAFIVMGTEIDDAFLQIAAWRRTNPMDCVEKRLGDAYSETGVSITITSLTSIISFCIGMTSPFPVIRIFCAYAAITICFAYLYQITFFGSCMALSGFTEKNGMNSLIFCHVQDKENRKLPNTNIHEDFILAKFREVIGSLLTNRIYKFVILSIFIINVSIAVWALKYIKIGNELSDAFSDNSQTGKFTNLLYKHFHAYLYPVNVIIDTPLDYNNFETRKAVNDTLNILERHENVAKYDHRISWLKYYSKLYDTSFGKFAFRGFDMTKKQDFIDALTTVFLRLPQATLFKTDIVFNENHTEIISSRFISGLVNISSGEQEANVIQSIYKIVDELPIPIKIYGMNFHLIEQAFLIKKVMFQVGLITSALIFVIFFIFIPDIFSVICVAIVIFFTILETISYMSLWGAKIDLISLLTFILTVGFSINYPTHISYSFIVRKDLNSDERIKKCLYEVGLPIFQGVFTTILSIAVFAFRPFYLTVTTFKILFLLTILTGFHSML
ncbi:patched domain-containing protein 3-like [Centruroides vittatus]|uniref:patched domain-containing protein 3-like n=1 Tax=Centruroides vittatus TaxID=120091 RepID=UPI00350F6FD6